MAKAKHGSIFKHAVRRRLDRQHGRSRPLLVGGLGALRHHVEGLHRVADVHDLRRGIDVEDDTLDRPHEVIVEPKVGSQRDDRTMRQLDPRWKAERVRRQIA